MVDRVDPRRRVVVASASNSDHGRLSKEPNSEEPPNSRLFILCGRNVTEEELREPFEKFGTIKDLWIVKDRGSGESKGVAYVKYGKTSEAAVAMEEMHGKFVGNGARALKVLIASNRDQGSRRDGNEEERLNRLFIIVPKSMSEKELREHFTQFGDVEQCNVVRGRDSKESKGYAYVKFYKISHAAKAFEGCDKSFKAVFADPPRQRQQGHEDRDRDRYNSSHRGPSVPVLMDPVFQPLANHGRRQEAYQHSHSHNPDSPGRQTLNIVAHGSVNQDQLWRLCDFFPGLDYCTARHDSNSGQCLATALYSSSQAAQFAKEKLHGFEYPPGYRLIVKFEAGSEPGLHSGTSALRSPNPSAGYPLLRPNMTHNERSNPSALGSVSGTQLPQLMGAGHHPHPDLATLAETIAQATSLVQAAGLSSSLHPHPQNKPDDSYDPSFCSVSLPSPQPLAPTDSPVKERLFVVCNSNPPPIYALKDAFCRFGNLIDIFMLNGKNCGYAKYAKKGSAEDAKDTLHGQEVHGVRLKVFLAEPLEQRGTTKVSSAVVANPPERDSADQKCKRAKLSSGGEDEND